MRAAVAALLSLPFITQPALATELGGLAATMSPRSWARVTTTNPQIVSQWFASLGGLPAPGYDDSPAAWNSKKRQMMIVTATDPDLGGSRTQASPLFFYTDDTNTWTSGPRPTTATAYHGYDNVAWDDTNEVLYFVRPYYGGTEVYRYCVNNTPAWCAGRAGTWSTLPNRTATGGCYQQAIGAVYFDAMDGGSLLCYDGERGIIAFRESTGTWSGVFPGSRVAGAAAYHTCMEYSRVKQVAVFGCDGVMYKITANKTITRLPDPPCSLNLGVGNRTILADPVSGNFLVIGCSVNGQLWELNPDGGGTWTLIDGNLGTSGKICGAHAVIGSYCSADFYGASVSNYGVVVFWRFTSPSSADVWLYKHAAQAQTPPPAQPGNVTVR